ncbi:MAG: hypothetical protein ABR973_01435 [Candidatus Acidiferrales bacterium]|jgi:hypothetical protein
MAQTPENKRPRPFLIANPPRIRVPSENRERGTSLRASPFSFPNPDKRPPPGPAGTSSGGRYEGNGVLTCAARATILMPTGGGE